MIRIISLELLVYGYNPKKRLKISQEKAKYGRYYGKDWLEFSLTERSAWQEWEGTGKKMDKA